MSNSPYVKNFQDMGFKIKKLKMRRNSTGLIPLKNLSPVSPSSKKKLATQKKALKKFLEGPAAEPDNNVFSNLIL
jgi:hypothetical protein